ncbi:MAG: glycosyltransferase [Clostridia bacterium]|nr:glycosyltransferase [Clostridia bacterium]
MKIHIVCTNNGLLNEGMNNIATHFSKRFSQKHTVTTTSVRDIAGLIRGARQSDCVLFFVRAVSKMYWLIHLASVFNKNVWLVTVQKPEDGFISKVNKKPLKCSYLYLSEKDVKDISLSDNKEKVKFSAGIDAEKFRPVSKQYAEELKKKYEISPGKPLVIHVGHASKGRGVEDLALVDADKFERLFVDSGIFDNPAQKEFLESHGVKIIKGYLEHIEEIYQMADAYLFPTKSGNYVISVPLSIMEALSCGTAAVSYKVIGKKEIDCAKEGAVTEIENSGQINEALRKAVSEKSEKPLLKNFLSWDDAADFAESVITKGC